MGSGYIGAIDGDQSGSASAATQARDPQPASPDFEPTAEHLAQHAQHEADSRDAHQIGQPGRQPDWFESNPRDAEQIAGSSRLPEVREADDRQYSHSQVRYPFGAAAPLLPRPSYGSSSSSSSSSGQVDGMDTAQQHQQLQQAQQPQQAQQAQQAQHTQQAHHAQHSQQEQPEVGAHDPVADNSTDVRLPEVATPPLNPQQQKGGTPALPESSPADRPRLLASGGQSAPRAPLQSPEGVPSVSGSSQADPSLDPDHAPSSEPSTVSDAVTHDHSMPIPNEGASHQPGTASSFEAQHAQQALRDATSADAEHGSAPLGAADQQDAEMSEGFSPQPAFVRPEVPHAKGSPTVAGPNEANTGQPGFSQAQPGASQNSPSVPPGQDRDLKGQNRAVESLPGGVEQQPAASKDQAEATQVQPLAAQDQPGASSDQSGAVPAPASDHQNQPVAEAGTTRLSEAPGTTQATDKHQLRMQHPSVIQCACNARG